MPSCRLVDSGDNDGKTRPKHLAERMTIEPTMKRWLPSGHVVDINRCASISRDGAQCKQAARSGTHACYRHEREARNAVYPAVTASLPIERSSDRDPYSDYDTEQRRAVWAAMINWAQNQFYPPPRIA